MKGTQGMKGNKRIDNAIRHIPLGSVLADIGCDHGYVLIEGMKQGRILSGIGIEINEGPLAQAKENVFKAGLGQSIQIRKGNGLEPLSLEDRADVCVIGGMGGTLIRDILQGDEKKSHSFRRLILQPMNGEAELRRYLIRNGWSIINEEILALDRLYLYLIAEPGYMEIEDEFLYEVGPILAEKTDFGRELYVEENIRRWTHILASIRKGTPVDTTKQEKAEEKLKRWEEQRHVHPA